MEHNSRYLLLPSEFPSHLGTSKTVLQKIFLIFWHTQTQENTISDSKILGPQPRLLHAQISQGCDTNPKYTFDSLYNGIFVWQKKNSISRFKFLTPTCSKSTF